MNTNLAFIAFPIIFYVGMPFDAPEIGSVTPGSAAWKAGLAKGDQVESINGTKIQDFKVLLTEAALSGDDGLLLQIKDQGKKSRNVRVYPEYRSQRGIKQMGVGPAYDIDWTLKVEEGDNPARRAGLKDGDVLVSLNMGGKDMEEDFVLFRKSVQLHPETWLDSEGQATRTLKVVVQRGAKRLTIPLKPEAKKLEERRLLGIRPLSTRVAALRRTASRFDPMLEKLSLRAGQDLTQLEVRNAGGPKWIPIYDRSSFEEALAKADLAGEGAKVLLHFRRLGKNQEDYDAAPYAQIEIPAVLLSEEGRKALLDSVAFEQDLVSGRVQVTRYAAAWTAGMRDGDRLLALGGKPVKSWDEVLSVVKKVKGQPLKVQWVTAKPDGSFGPPETKEVRPQPLVVPLFGFGPTIQPKTLLYQSSGIMESLSAGASNSVFQIRQLYVTLKRILGGSVSSKNIGGVISISVYTYEKAKGSWQKFLYFLAILSLNLAFINILPIPVLDGGHLLFLIIEKIKGSPVSESVMTYAQYIGVALILSLVIYVTFNDIVRHILGG